MFRVLVGFSTLALLIEIVHYHINEILVSFFYSLELYKIYRNPI